MKKSIVSLCLAVVFLLSVDCKKNESDDNTSLVAALVALANGNCFNVPQKVAVKDGNSSAVTTYTCTVVGKVYTCVPGTGNTVVRTYSSAAAAKLGVVDPPPFSNQHVQRGLTGRVEGSTTNAFTYNSSNQLTAVASPTVTYSNYDTYGFPKTNSAGQTITNTYASGATKPTTSSDGAMTYTYDSNGWATKIDFGFGQPTTAENTGSLAICD
ncbi:hypothetical protein EHQ76_05080 [Leptospira barantonii]|uniref:YD repeat-containing protein n=1 Tax=Leptospira barantonii TaxID=2023184 RepID=A0A5F2BNN7_9LEPT|nr:hypothetical protein [Leptospira barantonii]TGM07173.1 hypothetical protein EHQ76_05080 [Leptospira barantonii]